MTRTEMLKQNNDVKYMISIIKTINDRLTSYVARFNRASSGMIIADENEMNKIAESYSKKYGASESSVCVSYSPFKGFSLFAVVMVDNMPQVFTMDDVVA